MASDAIPQVTFTLPAAAITAASQPWPFTANSPNTRATVQRVTTEGQDKVVEHLVAAIEKRVDRNEGRIDGVMQTLARMEGALGRIEIGISHLATKSELTGVSSAVTNGDLRLRNWFLVGAAGILMTLLWRTGPAAVENAIRNAVQSNAQPAAAQAAAPAVPPQPAAGAAR